MKEAVRRGEVGGHEIVVVEVGAVPVAHGAHAVRVEERRSRVGAGVVRGSVHKPIILCRILTHLIVIVPVHMGFVPRGAGVFVAHRNHVE